MVKQDKALCEKPLIWLGDSKEVTIEFPEKVRKAVGFALSFAQLGEKHPDAKPFRGITTGAAVLEVVEDFDGDTYRAVYTVKFEGIVYVLHSFQKKSKTGIKTPPKEVELIKKRFKAAEEDFKNRQKNKKEVARN